MEISQFRNKLLIFRPCFWKIHQLNGLCGPEEDIQLDTEPVK